jgi:hypothetical protein
VGGDTYLTPNKHFRFEPFGFEAEGRGFEPLQARQIPQANRDLLAGSIETELRL